MPRLEDAVRAVDGRWIGIRCCACSTVFIGTDRVQRHADHTWECPDQPRLTVPSPDRSQP